MYMERVDYFFLEYRFFPDVLGVVLESFLPLTPDLGDLDSLSSGVFFCSWK